MSPQLRTSDSFSDQYFRYLTSGEWPDCPSLRASDEHCFIVRVLRARRMVWLLPSHPSDGHALSERVGLTRPTHHRWRSCLFHGQESKRLAPYLCTKTTQHNAMLRAALSRGRANEGLHCGTCQGLPRHATSALMLLPP